MKGRFIILMALTMLCLTSTALAQSMEIQPFVGYRWGGSFDIDDPEAPGFDIAGGESYGLTIGWIASPSAQIDVLWSHQGTDLEVDGSITGHGDSLSGFDIDNFMIEGSWVGGKPEDKLRGFASFGIGATQFGAPDGFKGSRTQFALGIGGGVKTYFSKTVGLRFQARWTPTFFNSNESVFCSSDSGCFATTSGDYISQFEVTVGVIFRL